MIRQLKRLLKAIILTCCFIFSCKQEFDNPLSENYQGDYQFTISTPFTDSAAVYTPYRIIVRTTGTDDFKSFHLEENPVIDSQSIPGTDTFFSCTFTNIYSGQLGISGLRPNGKTVYNSIPLKVFNPFIIDGASLINETGNTYKIIRTAGHSGSDTLLTADWIAGDSIISKDRKITLPFFFKAPDGNYTLSAKIKGFSSEISTPVLNIEVRAEHPDPAFLESKMTMQSTAMKPFLITLPEISHGKAVSILWDRDADGINDTITKTGSLTMVYTNPGSKNIIVQFEDTSKALSLPCTVSVFVQKMGVPSIRSVQIDTAADSIYINDNRTFTVDAEDDEGEIVKIYMKNSTTPETDSIVTSGERVSVQFRIKQNRAGTAEYLFYALDNDGNYSDTVRKQYTFKTGKPEISRVTLSDDTIFQMDTLSISAEYFDINGTISSFYFNTGNKTDSVFHHTPQLPIVLTYIEAGTFSISFFVLDDDGISSDTIKKTVLVRSGVPKITSVSINRDPGEVFIHDTLILKVKGSDPDHSIDSISVFWNENSVEQRKAKGDSALFIHVFPKEISEEQILRIRIKDTHKFTSDTTYKITIRSGKPVIDSITPAETWIYDTVHFAIFAHDTNGVIRMYYIDYNNDTLWDDSSQTGYFSKIFSDNGIVQIRAGVRDDDDNYTRSIDSISVRKGTPRIWNTGDTMFVVCPPQGGNVKLKINSLDTNGTIQKFFWDYFESDGFDTTGPVSQGNVTTGDSIQVQISANDVNKGYRMAVFGIDDDGLLAGDTFWLYPDAPPPSVETTLGEKGGDSAVIHWKNMDYKDSHKTEYQILINEGDEPSVSDIAVEFKPGSDYQKSTLGTFQFMWTFKGGESGKTYYYRIVARDSRGSESPQSSKDRGSFSFQ